MVLVLLFFFLYFVIFFFTVNHFKKHPPKHIMSEQKQTAKKRTLTEDQRLNKVRKVPATTKRAMRACHLFANILKMHFDDGICELMDESSYDYAHYTHDILNNLLLVGD
eukprot:414985_1